MRHLVWLRADLRSIDNTALHTACADRAALVACVYAITPAQWQAHDVAGCRIDFELRTVALLSEELAALDIPLLIVHVADYADLPEAMAALCRQHRIDALFYNRQYELNELARDRAVETTLAGTGVRVHAFDDQCALPPGSLRTGDGRCYSVFTPFRRAWLGRLPAGGPTVLPRPRRRAGHFAGPDSVPRELAGFTPHIMADTARRLWPAGEKAALARLQRFAERRLRQYHENRDFPALEATSTLSPWLATGAISVRQCLNAALIARNAATAGQEGIDTWISELCWRDFYKHIMFGFPRVCRHQPFRLETRALRWRQDDAGFTRWCEGRTGFPIVDAAMRQLRETGWMHNRLRMVVAMFLTKDLFIDWRRGEQFFMRHLIDGDLAANNGGWQWSASTGNDAAPYFRVFNPTLQSRRYDPDGVFIRRYLPELAALDSRDIHAPSERGQGSALLDYPAPMVDHAAAKDFAVAQFRQLEKTG